MGEDANLDNSTEGIESSKRTRVVTQTKYPLPDNRTDFDPHHLKIISAYASLSLNGTKELRSGNTAIGASIRIIESKIQLILTIGC